MSTLSRVAVLGPAGHHHERAHRRVRRRRPVRHRAQRHRDLRRRPARAAAGTRDRRGSATRHSPQQPSQVSSMLLNRHRWSPGPYGDRAAGSTSRVNASEMPSVCWLIEHRPSGCATRAATASRASTKLCCSSCEPWISRTRSRSPGWLRIVGVSGSARRPAAASGPSGSSTSGSSSVRGARRHVVLRGEPGRRVRAAEGQRGAAVVDGHRAGVVVPAQLARAG